MVTMFMVHMVFKCCSGGIFFDAARDRQARPSAPHSTEYTIPQISRSQMEL